LLVVNAFIAGLFGTMTLTPWMALFRQNINSLPIILYSFMHYPYSGLWETDNGISPVLIGTFLIAILNHLRTRKKITAANLSKGQIVASLLLALATWFSLEYTLAKGWLYWLAHQLPIIKSLHFSLRFTSVFYFPLALLGALILHGWFQQSNVKRANSLFVFLNLTTLIFPLTYFLYTEDVHFRMFDINTINTAYQQSQHGATFPVTYVAEENVPDWYTIPLGATTQKPYEPIFGYRLEFFNSLIHAGSVFEINHGFFNMTNPASLTYPETNGGKTFGLFKADDQLRLRQFIERHQPDWNIPRLQIIFNYVSAISFLITCGIILIHFVLMKRNQIKP